MKVSRRRLLTWPGLPLLAAAARPAGAQSGPAAVTAAASAPALRMGLAPFLSANALLSAFRPLREQMARALGQPVELYTARDFRSLFEAARAGDYDLALLPAHLAALLARTDGWSPLVRTVNTTRVVVLVNARGGLAAPAQLRGQRVAMLDPLSLTATVGTLWLRAQGLEPSQEVQPVVMTSINSALLALQRDEVAAVVAATTQLATLPPALAAAARVLAQLEDIPAPLIMARPGVEPARLQRWREALLAFEPDPARPPSAANVRLTPLALADLAPLAHYAEVARQVLAAR